MKATIPIVQPTLHDFEAVMAEFRQAWESGQVTTGIFTRRFEAAVEEKLAGAPCGHGAVLHRRDDAGLEGPGIKGGGHPAGLYLDLYGPCRGVERPDPGFCGYHPGFLYPGPPGGGPGHHAPAPRPSCRSMSLAAPRIMRRLARVAQDNGLLLVYDSAQGLGSRFQVSDGVWQYSGGFGEAEVFSMSPTKVVSAMEGGLITTHNAELAVKLRQMRDYGKTPDGEDVAWLGLSARVPEINAIVARHNFYRMDNMVARRRELIAMYRKSLDGLPGVRFQEIPANCESSGNYFTVFIGDGTRASRDETSEYLKKRGIQAKKYFYPALHLQRVHAGTQVPYRCKLQVTETAAATGLALPLFSHMTPDVIQQVSAAVKEILQ